MATFESPARSGDDSSTNEKHTSPVHVENAVGATNTTAGGVTYTDGIDPVKERKLVRKIDAFVIPWVCLLYLSSFLDRSVLC